MKGADLQSHRWQGLRPTGKSLPDGTPVPGRPILVDCRGHVEAGLCAECVEEFRLVLADVPALLDDLDVAIAGEAEFVEHGARKGAAAAGASGGNAAIAAHQRLSAALALAGRWFDVQAPELLAVALRRHLDRLAGEPELARVAREVSSAVSRSHRVIDAPPDLWFYGPCPDCGRDIWQDRIHKTDEKTPVTCRFPSCGYAASLREHNRRQLADVEDRWMTVTELVAAFELGGEPVTRKQIEGWIRHHGLPREPRPTVRWRDGRLERTGEVWTYRVGDVRDMALRADLRRVGVRNARLTRRFDGVSGPGATFCGDIAI